MPLSPYLSFAGNCADAIAYYQRTLGAELLYKISFGEMPKSAQDSAENCPSGMQFPDTAIAHANVRIAGSDIMMSDAIPSGKASYSGFTLVLDSQQVEEGDAPRDKCTLSCAINGIHAAFHYLKKNYISGCVMTVPTGW